MPSSTSAAAPADSAAAAAESDSPHHANPFGEVNASVAVEPPQRVREGAFVSSMEQYREMHARSVDPKTSAAFWAEQARAMLTWQRPFSDAETMGGGFEAGDVRWFSDGQVRARGTRRARARDAMPSS